VLLKVLVPAFAGILMPVAGVAQPVSIIASIPDDLLRAPSEVLLEIVMTNVSDQSVGTGAAFYGPLWNTFGIDLRDAEGKRVAEAEAARKYGHPWIDGSSGPGTSLKAGNVLCTEVVLNRLFDLSRPGEYSVQVQWGTWSGLQPPVKSNIVRFRISDDPRAEAMKARFSLTISPVFRSVPAGWRIPVSVEICNRSEKPLRLAVWPARDDLEFGSGLEVHRSGDLLQVPLTLRGREFLSGSGWGRGGFLRVPIGPGETLTETRLIGQLSDVSRPGHYRIRASLVDPTSGRLVNSNDIEVEVTDPAERVSGQSEFRAPFVLTIRPYIAEDDPFVSGRPAIDTCLTNVSDHDIPVGSTTGVDEFRVRDEQGRSPLPTKVASNTQPYRSVDYLDPQHPLAPGGSNCTIHELAGRFELKESGDYSVQVGRIADLKWKPGPDKDYPPMVWSNTVTLAVGK
jgi:hypothetical protein